MAMTDVWYKYGIQTVHVKYIEKINIIILQ
jgi:hypothetical protein